MRVNQQQVVKMKKLALLLVFAFLGCENGDINKLESFSGKSVPENFQNIKIIDNWTSPSGDGYSIRIYKLGETESWIEEKNCEVEGFSKGMIPNLPTRIPVLEAFLNPTIPLCYKIDIHSKLNQAVFIQNRTVYFYWATS